MRRKKRKEPPIMTEREENEGKRENERVGNEKERGKLMIIIEIGNLLM